VRDLIKGMLKTGSGAVGNVLLGVISIKIMAVMLGPTGTGLFSLVRQAVVTFASLGAGGQTALVQGVASKQGTERDSYVRSIFWLFVLVASVSFVLIESFASTIAMLVFGKSSSGYVHLVRWIALPVMLMHGYIFLKGVLNGCRAIGRLALVEMAGPLITLMLVYPVSLLAGEGYVLAFVWMLSGAQLMMIASCLLILRKQGWIPTLLVDTKIVIKSTHFRYFLSITGTTFLTGIIGASVLLAVRAMIVRSGGGLAQAGLFDVAWSLSGNYVMLILASFGTYYAPTLSQTADKAERATLIRRVIRLSTMLMIPLIVTVVVLKPLLISLLYSSEYIASLKMIRWMLIGDYLKITSWVLVIPVIVNVNMKIYFWTEVFWHTGFLALSALAILYFGNLQGIGIAFVVLYACLVAYYFKYARRVYALIIGRDLLLLWLIGFFVVITVSLQNWSSTSVDWPSAVIWIMASFILVVVLLKKTERKLILSKLRLKLRVK